MNTYVSLILLLIVCIPSVFIPTLDANGETISLDGNFTWINAGRYATLNDNHPLNPGNDILEVPETSAVSEFRPNFKLVAEKIQIFARPRVRLRYEETNTKSDSRRSEGYSKAELNEGFASWILSDQFSFTVGLQNYQWGPAEVLSPSNRLFHVTTLARDVLFEGKGRHIGRLNYSVGQNFSVVLLSEYEENKNISPFVADEPFESTTALKGEVSWGGGANYFGIVFGGRQHGRPWLGEYSSVELPFIEGASFYVDASHQRGSSAYYPVRKPTASANGPIEVVVLEKGQRNDEKVESMVVGGLRYDFVQGTIARLEYILNEPGYTKDEQDLMRSAIASEEPSQLAFTEQNVRRALAPGLELPGRQYAFASLYIPNFLTVTDLSATTRMLFSLTDHSANSYLALEYEVGDAGSAFIMSSVNTGKPDSELAGFTRESYSGGYRYFW